MSDEEEVPPAESPDTFEPSSIPKTTGAPRLKVNLPDVFRFQKEKLAKATTRKGMAEASREKRKQGRQQQLILLIEGDDEVQRLIWKLLANENYQVLKAASWEEAAAILDKGNPMPTSILVRKQMLLASPSMERSLEKWRVTVDIKMVDDYSELFMGQVVYYDKLFRNYEATLDLLFSILECTGQKQRGHAHTVARHAKFIGHRLGLNQMTLDGLVLASYFHALGELKYIESDTLSFGHVSMSRRKKDFSPIIQWMANMEDPYNIEEVLLHRYDRYDGFGNASGLDRESIPIGARILAIVDTYDTMIRRMTGPQPRATSVVKYLRFMAGKRFDPRIVELFINVLRNDQLIQQLDRFHASILMVDPQQDDLNLLRLRLSNEGYQIMTAANLTEAMRHLEANVASIVLSEMEFEDGSGLDLIQALHQSAQYSQTPVIFLTTVDDSTRISQALEVGAEDVWTKPFYPDVICMKIKRILDRQREAAEAATAAGGGINGNLSDLSLIDSIQVLSGSGRSAKIELKEDGKAGQVYIDKGRIIHAQLGKLEGNDALYELVRWRQGEFSISPMTAKPVVNIQTSTDALLLEACRLVDEVAEEEEE
jgi:response regulator RpfG family c-di-GMP phosphodiesterase